MKGEPQRRENSRSGELEGREPFATVAAAAAAVNVEIQSTLEAGVGNKNKKSVVVPLKKKNW